jgi:hypothetical protein
VPVDKTKVKAGYNNGVPEISMPMIHKTSSSEIPVGWAGRAWRRLAIPHFFSLWLRLPPPFLRTRFVRVVAYVISSKNTPGAWPVCDGGGADDR